MYHVSTLLPHTPDNKQQIERKRHIGNDIVNIIFESGGDPTRPSFSPAFMKSHFTHIFPVVTYDASQRLYRLWVYSERSVPVYGPPLPRPNEFRDASVLREFLLTKLINGEKASFNADAFVEKRSRTLDTMIKDMYLEYLNQSANTSAAHKVAEPLPSYDKRALGADLFDFIKLGELIRLEKQLCGDVALSGPKQKLSIGTAARNKPPWQPQLLVRDAPNCESVLSSHAWGPISIAYASADGSVQLLDRSKLSTVIESDAQCKQIAVLEEFGIFLARCDQSKDGCLIACPLSDLSWRHRKSATSLRGCYYFSTSDPFALRLHIVACCSSRRVCLVRWAFGPLGPIEQGTNIVKNFMLVKELQVCDDVVSACVYEPSERAAAVRACFATKGHHIYLVDFTRSTVRCVPAPTSPKGKMRCVNASSDEDVEEIIYSYDNVSMVYTSDDQTHTPQTIFWSGDVQSVVYHFPYVLGFSRDVIEVRLVVNGNLLHSMFMPGVKLLSDKRDIIFSVDRHYSPPNSAYSNNQQTDHYSNQQKGEPLANAHGSGDNSPIVRDLHTLDLGTPDAGAGGSKRQTNWLWKKTVGETNAGLQYDHGDGFESMLNSSDSRAVMDHTRNDPRGRVHVGSAQCESDGSRQSDANVMAPAPVDKTAQQPRPLKVKQKSAVNLADNSRALSFCQNNSHVSLADMEGRETDNGLDSRRVALSGHMYLLIDSECATLL